MEERDARIRGGGPRKGTTLVGVYHAEGSGLGGPPRRHDSLEYFGKCGEKDDNTEGSRGVIGHLTRFIEHNPISSFEGRGVEPVTDEGGVIWVHVPVIAYRSEQCRLSYF